jgi:O-antigen/teichoic acid export membrane protein
VLDPGTGRAGRRPLVAKPAVDGTCKVVRDSLVVVAGGQLERAMGAVTALALRWGLEPATLGVYTGLRLLLDNTNRSSLGVSLGAVQNIPILRAAGRQAEAERVANVAHTVNTITCVAYSIGLAAWAAWQWHAPGGSARPLAAEWTVGLVAVALLAILKRYETFHIAVLRAHQEFGFTTRVDLLEALVSGGCVIAGLALAGFWGLLGAVGVILAIKIAYIRRYSQVRLGWAFDLPLAWQLLRVGVPILANTVAFGCILGLDRVLIFAVLPEAERAVGLYSIALLGSSWCLDLAGRVVLVLYPHFQNTYGRTDDVRTVAGQAARATEIQAVFLSTLAAFAFIVAPGALGWLLPRYAEGLPALRPLLPGTLLLALAWPSRQLLVAIGRSGALLAATLVGLGVTLAAAFTGARAAGLPGLASGMSIGYLVVFLLTSGVALVPHQGRGEWLAHLARVGATLAWPAAAVGLASGLTARLAAGVQPLAHVGIVAVLLLPQCASALRRIGPHLGARGGRILMRGGASP